MIDCSGSYGNPNLLGDGGIPAPGERALEDRIVRYLPSFDEDHWGGAKVLLTGSGHSAQTAARALARLPDTKVVWAVRNPLPDWGAVEDDPLPERASLNATAASIAAGESPGIELLPGTVTESLAERDGRVAVTLRNGGVEEVVVDRILALNGGVGDASIYRQLQVHECYASCAPMKLAAALLADSGADCLEQTGHGPETLVNPEPGFFILGAKSYGRNSQFLLAVGWQQVDDVFASLLRRGSNPRAPAPGPQGATCPTSSAGGSTRWAPPRSGADGVSGGAAPGPLTGVSGRRPPAAVPPADDVG